MNRRLIAAAFVAIFLLLLPQAYTYTKELEARWHAAKGCKAFAEYDPVGASPSWPFYVLEFSKAAQADVSYLPLAHASSRLNLKEDEASAKGFKNEWRDGLATIQMFCLGYQIQ